MLVRINRQTLRRNPNAGNTTSVLPGIAHSELTFTDEHGRYEFTNAGDDWYCRSCVTTGPLRFQPGEVVATDTLIADPSKVRVTTHGNNQIIHHQPEPDWLYEYEPTPVTCNNCGETFDATELTSDCAWTGDDEICSFEVCPKCDAWECCEVEYEQPDDVARELGM